MALRLRIRRKDVIRIGDALIGIDIAGDGSGRLIVLIDAPRDQKIVWLPDGMQKPFGVLREELGMTPQTSGARDRREPAA